jgi:hypothetical protein
MKRGKSNSCIKIQGKLKLEPLRLQNRDTICLNQKKASILMSASGTIQLVWTASSLLDVTFTILKVAFTEEPELSDK